MLSRLIFGESPRSQVAVITPTEKSTWSDLQIEAERISNTHGRLTRRRIGLSLPSSAICYAALAALERLECDTFLLDGNLSIEDSLKRAAKLRLGAVLRPSLEAQEVYELAGEEAWSGTGTVTILTSGSTGEPKAVRYAWEKLARPIRKSHCEAPVWLLTYRPNLYAGLQVALQCLADRGALAIPSHGMEPQAIAQFMYDHGVQFVSATPSYWRRLLMFADQQLLKKLPLVQLTLGGEVVDQTVLDNLRSRYPTARLVHIFATSELGRCFSVSDALSGFPASYLGAPLPDGVELRVEQGELLVRSENAMRMYDPVSCLQSFDSGWFATGDLVEVSGDRVHFVGRKSDMINVAGSKVYPIEVERIIRDIPGVFDVRVYGKVSSVAGELVACEIVPEPNQDTTVLKEAVSRKCRTTLTTYQQPRLIKFVERIHLSQAGKALRSSQQ